MLPGPMLGRQGTRAGCRAFGWQQVGEGDGLLAMGTEPAGPDAATELLALLAPLLPQVARTARWTLVDRRGLGQADRHVWEWGGMALAPRGLTAGRRTEALAPGGGKDLRADWAGYRYAIVTQRLLSHGCLLPPLPAGPPPRRPRPVGRSPTTPCRTSRSPTRARP